MALLCAVFSVAWGVEATFNPSDFSGQGTSGTGSAISATVNDVVTFSCDKGYGTTQIRCYSGGKITITSTKTITAINFTFSGDYKGGLKASYTKLSTNSWEETLTSQARLTKIVVTYDGEPVDASVTFENDPFEIEMGSTGAWNRVTKPNEISPSYSIANDNIATINSESGAVYPVSVGETTVTATWAATDNYKAGSASYTLKVIPKTMLNPNLTINNLSLMVGKTKELTVNSESDGEITITPSNSSIASITIDNGKYIVTGLSAGIETFTATQAATEDYLESTITFDIAVKEIGDVIFYESFDKFDTTGGNDGDFAAGSGAFSVDKCDNAGWNVTAANGANHCIKTGSNKTAGKAITPAINYEGDAILTFKAAAWNNKDDETTLKISISGGSLDINSVTMSKTKWTEYTITITNMPSNAKITFEGDETGNKHRFFLDEVRISKLQSTTPITATFNPKYKGKTSIYYSDKNLKVPEDVTAYTYAIVDGKGQYQDRFAAGEVIPAGTGVVLEYGKDFTENVTVTFEEGTADEAKALTKENQLQGYDEKKMITINGNTEDYYFYRLSIGKSDSPNAGKVGFYWANSTGAPFEASAHKIFLVVSKAEADNWQAASFSLEDITGINSTVTEETNSQDIYSLSGIRMNNKNLPKGIYIVNGKKVIIK